MNTPGEQPNNSLETTGIFDPFSGMHVRPSAFDALVAVRADLIIRELENYLRGQS